MAKDLAELIHDSEPDLLDHHSRRVYLLDALTVAEYQLDNI